MKISLIWAMDKNRLIGINNSLPWKLPADMQWFRKHSLDKPIVMGRKTFESFGSRPLPQRTNIIVTRNPDYKAEGAIVTTSIDDALAAAGNVDEVMIIGGESFYEQMLPHADRLYITEVQGEFDGDAWFPQFDSSKFREIERSAHPIDEKNSYECHFMIFERS
jgi:dihydrofolate reductase